MYVSINVRIVYYIHTLTMACASRLAGVYCIFIIYIVYARMYVCIRMQSIIFTFIAKMLPPSLVTHYA